MVEVNSGKQPKGYSYWLEVAEDNSLLPSHNYYSAVSILHVTQVATSIKSSAIAVKPVSNLQTREPGSEATISTATHFSACTFYCSLAFISAKYT